MTPNTLAADGGAIQKIVDLANATQGKAEFLAFPPDIVPKGAVIEKPHALVVTTADGKVDVRLPDALIDKLRGRPMRRVGVAKATTLDSFVDLVERHKAGNSAIFVEADWRKPALTAVIDYHLVAGSEDAFDAGDDSHARFGQHRVHYQFPLSEPWKQWIAGQINASAPPKWMSQEGFAQFLEDHIHELSSPSAEEARWMEDMFRARPATPAQMLDLARGLEINVESKVKARTKLASGESTIVFEQTHRDAAGAEIDVPGLFVVQIPLFYEGETVRLYARLRYRVAGEAIVWGYDIHRPDEIVNAAVRNAVTVAREQTRLPCYDGAPEMAA